ncbi:MAG: DUF4062 domain-containing protein [Verrucomicrobia bacterium]|nr:DUF4062 domain-containing protein [Verrucomicrobiota bacterium]
MPRILKIVIASPSDVQDERDIVENVANELNRGIAASFGRHLEVARWETDAYPSFHLEGPQGLIDSILGIEDCDILIGIFWKRFGTPTKSAKSGTEHEFRRAYKVWKKKRRPQIMVYFNQKPYTLTSKAETKQLSRLQRFKDTFPEEGLWWEYNGKRDFERLVRRHLEKVINGEFGKVIKELGIIDGAMKLSESLFEPTNCMKETNRYLDFLGILGSKWISQADVRKTLKDFLDRINPVNGRARFLLINPSSPSFKDFQAIIRRQIKPQSLEHFHELTKACPCLQVRLYDHLPCFRLVFVDKNKVCVSKYAVDEEVHDQSDHGWDAPHLVFMSYAECPWSLHTAFMHFYEHLWNHSIDLNTYLDQGHYVKGAPGEEASEPDG